MQSWLVPCSEPCQAWWLRACGIHLSGQSHLESASILIPPLPMGWCKCGPLSGPPPGALLGDSWILGTAPWVTGPSRPSHPESAGTKLLVPAPPPGRGEPLEYWICLHPLEGNLIHLPTMKGRDPTCTHWRKEWEDDIIKTHSEKTCDIIRV